MKTIKQILAEKTRPLSTVGPGDTVQSAMELMRERDIGAVMVVDGKKLVGIFTERDCLQKVSSFGLNAREILVREVMTEKVRFVTPDMVEWRRKYGIHLVVELFQVLLSGGIIDGQIVTMG